ncbi:MAG TPA: EthD family reductase [Pseudolysinimonas sp.]|nr:EthD family reductase [Pseudolysinimonas sp.]
MHKLVVLYPAPADPEAFRSHYLGTHLPLVAQLPGLIAHRYSLDVASPEGEAPYFAVFEADFADAPAMGAALGSPEGAAVQADVPRYATGGAIVMHYPISN